MTTETLPQTTDQQSFCIEQARQRLDAAERQLEAARGWALLGGLRLNADGEFVQLGRGQ